MRSRWPTGTKLPLALARRWQHCLARLNKLSYWLQVRKRKWDNYSSGEELFGLPVTQYPELEKTEKEVVMLDRLYT